MRRAFIVAAVAAVALVATQASVAKPVRITVIGDSVATAMAYEPTARKLLAQGVDARLDLAVCRRILASSCPFKGIRPPTVVELARGSEASLGQVVVVAVGYNDYEQTFRDDVEAAIAALRKAGVQRVFWLTLRAERQSYLAMNNDLELVAKRNPELTVIDWNAASRGHPDWLQEDGIHVSNLGAVRMAELIHDTLTTQGVALPQVAVRTARLPWAKLQTDYRIRLKATGGSPPYRWVSLTRAPRGLHLTSDGRLFGVPRVPGSYPLSFRVEDAQGTTATQALNLKVVS